MCSQGWATGGMGWGEGRGVSAAEDVFAPRHGVSTLNGASAYGASAYGAFCPAWQVRRLPWSTDAAAIHERFTSAKQVCL